jgi:uncharacterized membrane protein
VRLLLRKGKHHLTTSTILRDNHPVLTQETTAMTPRTVSAGNGWTWIADGFSLFTKNAVMWVVLAVVLIVCVVVINLIPLLGGLAFSLLWPVLVGGLLLGCRALDNGQPLELPHLFAGFQSGDRLQHLIIVGAVYLVATIVALAIVVAAIGVPALQALRAGGSPGGGAVMSMIGTFFLGLLIALALMVPVMMAMWFAPPLILFNNMAAMDAMKLSFSACLRNIVPFLLYGVIAFVLNIIAAIPFGLGYLVLLPVLVCSLYAGYKDIFAESAPAAPDTVAAGNPLLR